jgi:hypothetical protein
MARSPNLTLRPAKPALGRGRVQRAALRALRLFGTMATSEIMQWVFPGRSVAASGWQSRLPVNAAPLTLLRRRQQASVASPRPYLRAGYSTWRRMDCGAGELHSAEGLVERHRLPPPHPRPGADCRAGARPIRAPRDAPAPPNASQLGKLPLAATSASHHAAEPRT